MKDDLLFGLDESGPVSYLSFETGLPVWAAFSTRKGGAGNSPRTTANMAYHVDDDRRPVEENRRLLSVAVTGHEGVPVYTASQVHGNRFLLVDGSIPTAVSELENQPADSLITASREILLGVTTADCLPVLLVDRQVRAVAAVHAGWRGLLARIVPRTIMAMEINYGVKSADLLVLLGPCIGRCCYQVGKELVRKFAAEPPFAADHTWYDDLSGDYYLDLLRLQVLQLQEVGVPPAAIKSADQCTACGNFFFSYRRERGITARQIAVVGLMG